jgi:hypothetical protein
MILLHKLEAFPGLCVVTYAVMSNHSRLLDEEPRRAALPPLVPRHSVASPSAFSAIPSPPGPCAKSGDRQGGNHPSREQLLCGLPVSVILWDCIMPQGSPLTAVATPPVSPQSGYCGGR